MEHEVLRYSDILVMLKNRTLSGQALNSIVHKGMCFDGTSIEFNFENQCFPSFSLLFDRLPQQCELIYEDNETQWPSSYLSLREQVWEESKRQLGGKVWNGKLLALTRLRIESDSLSLFVRECEYKDVMLKRKKSPALLQNLYPDERVTAAYFYTSVLPWIPHSLSLDNSQLLQAHDMKSAVLGRVGGGTINHEGSLSLLGGTLNTDEFTLKDFEDIRNVAVQELYEEANIVNIDGCNLNLFSLNYRADHGSIHSLFTVAVSENCIDNFEDNTEISEILIYNEDQIKNTVMPKAFNVQCLLSCLSRL